MGYEDALKEALRAVKAQAAQRQAASIEAGNAAYGQLKEQADVRRSLERQRLAKRMAEMGIAAPTSLTVQNNSMMAGYGDIGDISRQNKSYAGMQNAMKDWADADAAAQEARISAGMNAAEDALELEATNNRFDRYFRLYMAKKMTRSQFKKKTGMSVRGWAVRRTRTSVYGNLLKKGKAGTLTGGEIAAALSKGWIGGDQAKGLYNYVKGTDGEHTGFSGMKNGGTYWWNGVQVPYNVYKELHNANYTGMKKDGTYWWNGKQVPYNVYKEVSNAGGSWDGSNSANQKTQASGYTQKAPDAWDKYYAGYKRRESISKDEYQEEYKLLDDLSDSSQSFLEGIGKDAESRKDVYQNADELNRYRVSKGAGIDSLTSQALSLKDYYKKNKQYYDALYGEGTADKVVKSIDEQIGMLNKVKSGLAGEYAYWNSFKDENDYAEKKKAYEDYENMSIPYPGAPKRVYEMTPEEIDVEIANAKAKLKGKSKGIYAGGGQFQITYDTEGRKLEDYISGLEAYRPTAVRSIITKDFPKTVEANDRMTQTLLAQRAQLDKNDPDYEKKNGDFDIQLQALKDNKYYLVTAKDRAEIEKEVLGAGDLEVTAGKAANLQAGIPEYEWVLDPASYIFVGRKVNPKYNQVLGAINNPKGGLSVLYDDDFKYNLADEKIRKVIRYLSVKAEDDEEYKDKLDRYVEAISRELDKQRSEWMDKTIRDTADSMGWFGNISAASASMFTNLGSGFALADAANQSTQNSTGKYEPVNPYSLGMLPAQMTDTLRDVSLEDASPFVKELGNFGYGIGDTLMALPFGPHIAPILLASEAGGKTAYDIAKRGGTPEQAFWGGITTAAIEWATNIIPIGKLFKIAEPGTKFFSKEAVTNILKQAGIQGPQGWVAEITEGLTDYAIMGDRSQLGLRIKELIESDISPGEAQKQAFNEFFIEKPLMAAASGFISGGAFAAGANAVSDIRGRRRTSQYVQNSEAHGGLDLQGKSGYNIGQKSGNSSYANYLRMLDEVDAANKAGMHTRDFAESMGVPSTLTDEEAAILDEYGIRSQLKEMGGNGESKQSSNNIGKVSYDFNNVKNLNDFKSRIPPNAKELPWRNIVGGAAEGIRYQWTDAEGNLWGVRAHSIDPGAPLGSNASKGWVYRVEVRWGGIGKKYYMDSSGNFHPYNVTNPNSPMYDEEIANDTHIILSDN